MTGSETYPKVSIVVPTYNRAQYILDAVNSILAQTYSNWELLIVDDCSTDNTRDLIKQVKDERIQLHQTASRVGVTATRNVGLKNCTGELIAFIDSDDLWASSKLQKQIAALHRYPDAGFCLTGGYNFRKLDEPIEYFYKQKDGLIYGDLFLPFFKKEVSATTPSFLFRKHYLGIVGLFNEAKTFADVDFLLRIARVSKGIILYESLFFRRLHDSNISNKNWENGYKEGIELISSYKHLLPAGLAKTALFGLYINAGEKYLKYDRKKKAISSFIKAWKQKPFAIIPFKKIAKALLYSVKRK
jgi:glycosyltransferase involved in cell wall biosynthesis